MRTWWPLVPLMAAACTAQIGSSQGPAGTGVSAGGAGGGAGTPGGAGGGTVGTGGNPTGTTGGGNGATGGGSATSGPQDPGRVTIRRLNRAEYDNTVRDLLGTAQTPGATTFPSDAPALGFDNNGDLQTLSPVQFTLYQQAAESLAAEVMTVGSKERAALITCDLTTGMTCAQTLIQNIGLRAFRRPLTATEVTNFTGLMTTAAGAGATTDEQFRTVLEAMLQSPNFLFRPEIDADVTSLTPHTLSPYEAASRLSYMVYRSMPDTALFTAAANGQLAQPSDVQTQLARMLAASNSVFGPTFSSMWLGTSAVSTQSFDATLFPEFNASLANSMSLEVNDFFNEFVTQNEPVSQLLTANFSYIDANLASLYQNPGARRHRPGADDPEHSPARGWSSHDVGSAFGHFVSRPHLGREARSLGTQPADVRDRSQPARGRAPHRRQRDDRNAGADSRGAPHESLVLGLPRQHG